MNAVNARQKTVLFATISLSKIIAFPLVLLAAPVLSVTSGAVLNEWAHRVAYSFELLSLAMSLWLLANVTLIGPRGHFVFILLVISQVWVVLADLGWLGSGTLDASISHWSSNAHWSSQLALLCLVGVHMLHLNRKMAEVQAQEAIAGSSHAAGPGQPPKTTDTASGGQERLLRHADTSKFFIEEFKSISRSTKNSPSAELLSYSSVKHVAVCGAVVVVGSVAIKALAAAHPAVESLLNLLLAAANLYALGRMLEMGSSVSDDPTMDDDAFWSPIYRSFIQRLKIFLCINIATLIFWSILLRLAPYEWRQPEWTPPTGSLAVLYLTAVALRSLEGTFLALMFGSRRAYILFAWLAKTAARLAGHASAPASSFDELEPRKSLWR